MAGETTMLHKIITLAAAAILTALVVPSNVSAWGGAARVGYGGCGGAYSGAYGYGGVYRGGYDDELYRAAAPGI
jgi:hypothetical protein